MSGVITFPERPRRRRTITSAEIHAAPEPSDEMVWNVCPYLGVDQDGDNRCRGCPHHEIPDEAVAQYCEPGDTVQRDCRALAEEACRIVLAQQAKDAIA